MALGTALLLLSVVHSEWRFRSADRCSFDWATKYVAEGSQTISLEELRRVFGLESIKDPEGNVIREAPLPVWANFQQRAIDVAILEIKTKTDLKIKLVATERSNIVG